MPHIKLQYHSDDPWTPTDLIEWARREEASSRVSSTGGASDSLDANTRLMGVLDMYEGQIERLEERVQSQEEEITRLRQLLNSQGKSALLPFTHLFGSDSNVL